MIIAMDLFGSLQSFPTLRRLAGVLLDGGQPVCVISAVDVNDPHEEKYRAEIESWGVPFASVDFVRFKGPARPDGAVEYAIGGQKVEVMRRVGATILFDDNPWICKAVRDAGFLACQLVGREGA
jgi:hypothetical protein